jgi:hypothetical protein
MSATVPRRLHAQHFVEGHTMVPPYIEEDVLRMYVWEHFSALMTPLELEIRKGIHVHLKAAHDEPDKRARKIEDRWAQQQAPKPWRRSRTDRKRPAVACATESSATMVQQFY